MALPLQIRITEHEATLTAAVVPYGISMLTTLDFAFLVEVDGEELVLSPHEYTQTEEFFNQCHGNNDGKFCSAPGAGSAVSTTIYSPKKGYVGAAEHANDKRVTIEGADGKGKVGTVRKDGILTEPWMDDDGNVVLTPAQEKAAHEKLKEMGLSYEELRDNATRIAVTGMDKSQEDAQADAVWYHTEHEWGVGVGKEFGVSVDQVMGITAVTSTLKSWDGPPGSGSNKETAVRILQILKDDTPVVITKKMADAYNKFSTDPKSATKGGKYGPKTIEPGELRPSQMSSGMLARVMGSGYGIGGMYKTPGLFKAFAIARGEMSPNEAIPSLKQRSFFNNLVHPDINYSCTNDFWMVRAMFGNKKLNLRTGHPPETVREWEKATNGKPNQFIGSDGTGKSSLFAIMTKAAREALSTLAARDPRFAGFMIHQFQAVDWVQMQDEYKAAGLAVD